jgi:starch-binding outer membrane protein, SusD/RagB family
MKLTIQQILPLKKIQKPFVLLSFAALVISVTSCEDMLNVDQRGLVSYEENYKNEFDSRSAAMGIAGLFQQTISGQYVLLGELRSDLMDVTENADAYMRELSEHNVSADNPYANPRSFYKVILNCNDALYNIQYMRDSGLLSEAIYNRDYSEIAGFRAWMYYLLAVHFGEVPYVTTPIENTDMINDKDYPVLGLETIIDSLVVSLQEIPNLDLVDWAVSIDDYAGINRAFVDKKVLLGDLLLWQENYAAAANIYKQIMDRNDPSGRYSSKTSYIFGYGGEEQSEQAYEWRDMFRTYVGGVSASTLYREWRWYCIIDSRFDQFSDFIKYFSFYNGDYMLKPSEYAMALWEEDTVPGGEFDKRGEEASWAMEGGNPVVQKYLYGVEDQFSNDADLYVFRIGTIYLRYAEAVNRLGQCELALAILNPQNNSLADDPRARSNNSLFNFDDYYLRVLTSLEVHASSRGVRGRVSLPPVTIPASVQTLQDSILFIEDALSKEYAKEVAFEGERWQNLLRFALRRERESAGTGAAFLANTVAAKFEAKGETGKAQEVRQKLMNRENWFLPME